MKRKENWISASSCILAHANEKCEEIEEFMETKVKFKIWNSFNLIVKIFCDITWPSWGECIALVEFENRGV